LNSGFYANLPLGLRNYLVEKLTENAARDHIDAGMESSKVFETTLQERLILPNEKRRKIAVIPAGEIIDWYGMLLAYIAPWFSNDESDPLPPKNDPRRRTFNIGGDDIVQEDLVISKLLGQTSLLSDDIIVIVQYHFLIVALGIE
jgi:hypothetical protein